MRHRHINTADWTLMAIESLFDRGDLADWREFSAALKASEQIARDTLRVCDFHEDSGAKAIARALVEHFHPKMVPHSTSTARG
jgi:hypothetical protein